MSFSFLSPFCYPLLNQARISISPESFDLIHPDEGGLIAVLEYGFILDGFFRVPQGTVKRVQSPVKIQPHELDSFFVLKKNNTRISIPCEAKSKGNDAITLNQIVGITSGTLQRLLEDDMSEVIPIGAKIEKNGDIFIAQFAKYTPQDLLNLKSKLTENSVTKTARYQLDPMPSKW